MSTFIDLSRYEFIENIDFQELYQLHFHKKAGHLQDLVVKKKGKPKCAFRHHGGK